MNEPQTTADEKPVGSDPLGPTAPGKNVWQYIALAITIGSIVVTAYAFFDNIQDLFSDYVEHDKRFQQEWLELDTDQHGQMFEALEDMKLEIVQLQRDVKDGYQISQHLIKEKIPHIEKRQDDIMEKISDTQLECVRGGK